MQAPSRTRELLVALFLLGALLLAPPLLIIFNKADSGSRHTVRSTSTCSSFGQPSSRLWQWWIVEPPRRRTTMLGRNASTETAGTEPAGGKPADA